MDAPHQTSIFVAYNPLAKRAPCAPSTVRHASACFSTFELAAGRQVRRAFCRVSEFLFSDGTRMKETGDRLSSPSLSLSLSFLLIFLPLLRRKHVPFIPVNWRLALRRFITDSLASCGTAQMQTCGFERHIEVLCNANNIANNSVACVWFMTYNTVL